MSSLEFDNLRRETTVRVQIEGRGEGFSKWGAKNIIQRGRKGKKERYGRERGRAKRLKSQSGRGNVKKLKRQREKCIEVTEVEGKM